MFAAPGALPNFADSLSRSAAERIARNSWMLLLNGLLLFVAGVLIFTIDWSTRSLATFIGALFIFEGVSLALTSGIDHQVRRVNVVTGLLSVAAGIAIIVWPAPGIVAVAIFLGAWLIVMGTMTISGSLAARRFMSDWWLLLLIGLVEVPLGVLALADPGATLAALVTVGGIWTTVIGVMRITLAFELRHLPELVDRASAQHTRAPAPLPPTGLPVPPSPPATASRQRPPDQRSGRPTRIAPMSVGTTGTRREGIAARLRSPSGPRHSAATRRAGRAAGHLRSIAVALAANVVVAAAKLAAGLITGSSALLSEAVHSVADSINEVLLWVSMRRGVRPADAEHPLGYGGCPVLVGLPRGNCVVCDRRLRVDRPGDPQPPRRRER